MGISCRDSTRASSVVPLRLLDATVRDTASALGSRGDEGAGFASSEAISRPSTQLTRIRDSMAGNERGENRSTTASSSSKSPPNSRSSDDNSDPSEDEGKVDVELGCDALVCRILGSGSDESTNTGSLAG